MVVKAEARAEFQPDHKHGLHNQLRHQPLIALMDLTMSLMTVFSVLTVVKVMRLDFGFSVTVCHAKHGIMLSVLI